MKSVLIIGLGRFGGFVGIRNSSTGRGLYK